MEHKPHILPRESVNICVCDAMDLDLTHDSLQRIWLNDRAFVNMKFISVTLDTFHFDMSTLKDVAPKNVVCMLVTRDTSQFDMSALKETAFENIVLVSVTRDTSHSLTGPCSPLEQSPSGDSWRQSSTALLRSSFAFGEKAGVYVCVCVRQDGDDDFGGRTSNEGTV